MSPLKRKLSAEEPMDIITIDHESPANPARPTTLQPSRKRQRLVLDDFDKEQLKSLAIFIDTKNLTPRTLAAMLRLILAEFQRKGVEFRRKITDSVRGCEEYFEGIAKNRPEDWNALCKALDEGTAEGNWDDFVDLDFIVKKRAHGQNSFKADVDIAEQEKATYRSWNEKYEGDAAALLWRHIVHHFKTRETQRLYANVCAIVQSSGMGKSRAVHELGKTRFLIPLCLRHGNQSGFPPADGAVRDYFIKFDAKTRNETLLHSLAFLGGLFSVTAEEVSNLKSQAHTRSITTEFYKRMRPTDSAMQSQYRIDFYDRVIKKALELKGDVPATTLSNIYKNFSPMSSQAWQSHDHPVQNNYLVETDVRFLARDGLRKLLEVLIPGNERNKIESYSWSEPKIVVAFDEAHVLKTGKADDNDSDSDDEQGKYKQRWSHFSTLRKVFRGLRVLPAFGIFLSTTGKLSQFNPSYTEDESARMQRKDNVPVPPFTDLGYDIFANRMEVEEDGTLYCETNDETGPARWSNLSLQEATSIPFMVKFGRPLFALRYVHGTSVVQEEIVSFATAKLLNAEIHRIDFTKQLEKEKLFACLSQRLAIEFRMTHFNVREEEKQVESHMRVCLKAEHQEESMRTTSGSEPLLAEAAAFVMNTPGFQPPRALKTILEGFSIVKGDKGELIVMLLLILARDRVVFDAAPEGEPDEVNKPEWSRLVKIRPFMESLVTESCLKDNIVEEMFRVFAEAYVHFNHFIRPHEQATCTLRYLIAYMTRAAALLCAANMPGIDIVIPTLFQTVFHILYISFILIQVKNNEKETFTARSEKLFSKMDPGELGLWGTAGKPHPVIRIIFSLSAKDGVHWQKRTLWYNDISYDSYDCWIGGLSSECLSPIKPNDRDVWKALGQAVKWTQLYTHVDDPKVLNTTRMNMHPGGGSDEAFWSNIKTRDPPTVTGDGETKLKVKGKKKAQKK